MDPREAQAAGSLNKAQNVVNIYGFLGPNFAGPERLPEDQRVGLAGAYRAGVGANSFWKIGEKVAGGFQLFYVDRIRV